MRGKIDDAGEADVGKSGKVEARLRRNEER